MVHPFLFYRLLFGFLTVLIHAACTASPAPIQPAPYPASTPQPQENEAIPTSTPLPQADEVPTASPSPTSPVPTPELMAGSVLFSTSPDGQWQAEVLLGYSYDPQRTLIETMGYSMDYARLVVYPVNGSQQWTPYEEWSETGIGDSFLSEMHWSADGRYLYFIQKGVTHPCGYGFVTNVRRVDLQDGSLDEIPLAGLGLGEVTVAPGAGQVGQAQGRPQVPVRQVGGIDRRPGQVISAEGIHRLQPPDPQQIQAADGQVAERVAAAGVFPVDHRRQPAVLPQDVARPKIPVQPPGLAIRELDLERGHPGRDPACQGPPAQQPAMRLDLPRQPFEILLCLG